jgi:hypothetical protein
LQSSVLQSVHPNSLLCPYCRTESWENDLSIIETN